MALKKNGKLFNEVKESKGFHAEVLCLLGKYIFFFKCFFRCYLEIGSYEDSLELL